jgi:hypothetical protein
MKNIAKHSEDISASVVLDLFDNNVNYFPPTLVSSECQQKKESLPTELFKSTAIVNISFFYFIHLFHKLRVFYQFPPFSTQFQCYVRYSVPIFTCQYNADPQN